jgi:hypothetical protein
MTAAYVVERLQNSRQTIMGYPEPVMFRRHYAHVRANKCAVEKDSLLASVLYFPFGQHLEEQLSAALVSAQLILKNGL